MKQKILVIEDHRGTRGNTDAVKASKTEVKSSRRGLLYTQSLREL